MALVKHSKRTIRTACSVCGETGEDYWYHDTDMPGDRCDDCNASGAIVRGDRDGNRHMCVAKPERDPKDIPPLPAPKVSPPVVKPVKEVSEPATPATDDTAAMATALSALRAVIGTPQIDRAEVERIAREVVGSVVFPTRTVIVNQGVTKEIEGHTHKRLADVIVALNAGEHVMQVGPAGTGKSTIAEQAADALSIPYYAISCNPQMPSSQLLGYMQAAGEYVSTLFRQAYESGGVFHFDEIDNCHPSTLAVINAALANGAMGFPDGMVKRHADFRCVASANTYGKGADRQYVGRQQMDAATLDRFTIVSIPIDELLERSICEASISDTPTVNRVLDYVRSLRKNAEAKKMLVVLSPRASVGMCRLLNAGVRWDDAVESRVRRGMSDADWGKLNG